MNDNNRYYLRLWCLAALVAITVIVSITITVLKGYERPYIYDNQPCKRISVSMNTVTLVCAKQDGQ